jgi:hypothetical protein
MHEVREDQLTKIRGCSKWHESPGVIVSKETDLRDLIASPGQSPQAALVTQNNDSWK